MKQSGTITYLKGNVPSTGISLQLESMNEFVKCITLYNPQAIFILLGNDIQYFAFLQQGLFIGHPTLGYNTLEDYKESLKANFPDAASFYEAREKGYSMYSDYKLVKEAGISDKKVFDQIQQQGYIEGYEEFVKLRNGDCLFENELLNSPYLLFKFCSARGFKNFSHFKSAIEVGFADAYNYDAAIEKGYKNFTDYTEGMSRGFNTGNIYYKASDLKIRDIEDFFKYEELIKYETSLEDIDKRLLLSVISKLPQRKKVSINKLTEIFFQELEKYRYSDTNEFPEWLIRTLFTSSDIKNFLESDNISKRFGTYDSDGEYFETKQINQRKVVLDGSNVAHAQVGAEKVKPMVQNMIRVVEKLQQKGFDQIVIIADASLPHKLSDKERLAELEKICEYKMAPAQTSADLFLIEYVKTERCLLVTNDTFRDWKMTDRWVAENIDYYKMTFMIEGDNVLMPDLDIV